MLTNEMIHSGQYAGSFLPYFLEQAQTQPSFLPELEVAQRVVALMNATDLAKEHIESIITEMHKLDNEPHYNGSAWHQFQNAVQWWLESRGSSL
ncbi:MAG: hypothetical protein IPK50_16490 [Fibrobacterota bacterium]|nr:MAG: hypothetical protein IPK50_16490 [Fibrobacterota bacterium]